jgi:broad specificity phosphatase PhoE
MAYRLLYLIRHGQFDTSARNPTGGLTAAGRRQARHTARALKAVPVTAIHVSTLSRAVETAAPFGEVFPGAKVYRSRRLWECVPPLTPSVRAAYFGHLTDEQLAEQWAYAERAYAHIVRRAQGSDKHEIVITHGNLIRYFVCRALDVDPAAWSNMRSRNCGITRIVVYPDGDCGLLSFNEVGHLPPSLITDNTYPLAF